MVLKINNLQEQLYLSSIMIKDHKNTTWAQIDKSNLTNPSKNLLYSTYQCCAKKLQNYTVVNIRRFRIGNSTTTTEYLQRVRPHRTQTGPAVHLFHIKSKESLKPFHLEKSFYAFSCPNDLNWYPHSSLSSSSLRKVIR